jgi:glycosyltransferase involved in cell wall biosynthesis
MLFSVIIPTFNRRALLEQALATVTEQTCKDYEVVVVDDGSNDGTLQYLAGLGDRLRWISQNNCGPGAARNAGAAIASGEYLAFLDSDDLWFPWSLAAIRTLLLAHERPSLLFAKFADFVDQADLQSIAAVDPPSGMAFDCYLASASHDFFAGAGMIAVDRIVFARSGGFTEVRLNGEDHDLALKLGEARGFVQVTEPVTLAHRVHPGNEMGNIASTAAGIARLIATEKERRYPGGERHGVARRHIISRHARAAAVACLKGGHVRDGWRLYRETLPWQLRDRKIAFLGMMPLLLAYSAVFRARR